MASSGRTAALGMVYVAWALAAFGDATVTNGVVSVAPGSAAQGAANVVVTFALRSGQVPPVPAAGVPPSAVRIGTIAGSAVTHTSQYAVAAAFTIPASEALGLHDVTVAFPYPGGTLTYAGAQLFEVLDGGSNSPAPRVPWPTNGAFAIPDTAQTACYDSSGVIAPPAAGQSFYGQDAQVQGREPAYRDNGDGTVSDLVTGLMWQQDPGPKVTFATAKAGADSLVLGGYTDWRLPTIHELYSLILFNGTDVSPCMTGTACPGAKPFLDTNVFVFVYGDTNAGERLIDAQYWSATEYVSTTMGGDATVFGVNFADGRIKGYPRDTGPGGSAFTEFVRYVRGNADYGRNHLVNNGDGTITDKATALMWTRDDSGAGLSWPDALAWVQARNAANYLGHGDWRLPNAKELQSIVDYTRSPDTTASAAIDPVFRCSAITNEAGAADFPCYWSSTTHADAQGGGGWGAYVCFGRAMGYQNGSWIDVHGAGAQRSDPKTGSAADYPTGHGPQGDAVRVRNHARLVRDVPPTNAWRFAFVGDTHVPLTTIGEEIAAAVVDDDARFLIVAGDLVEAGARASASTLRDQLTAWREAMVPATLNGVGLYAVRGNHEDDVTNGVAIWNEVFSGADAMPANGPAGESNLTYAVAFSNALIVGLDTYADLHRINQAWLDAQLAVHTQPHLFVFGHEPAFKAFHTDGLDDEPDARNTFWRSLSGAGARVYLCGHDHLFNVARVDDGDGDPANDVHQCIVGTGGSTNWPATAYQYNGSNGPYTPIHVTNITGTYGYLLVEIGGPGAHDLDVTLTWKQRTYDADTASYLYLATTNVLTYRAMDRTLDHAGDGVPDWWRAWRFGGVGTGTNALSCAACDADGDGATTLQEYQADTDPNDADSRLAFVEMTGGGDALSLTWAGGLGAWQVLEQGDSLGATGTVWSVVASNAPPTAVTNAVTRAPEVGGAFYRIKAWR